MVVPVGECSIATTRACFELCPLIFFRSFADVILVGCDGRDVAVLVATVLEARLLADFDIGILHSVFGGITSPPPKPHLGY